MNGNEIIASHFGGAVKMALSRQAGPPAGAIMKACCGSLGNIWYELILAAGKAQVSHNKAPFFTICGIEAKQFSTFITNCWYVVGGRYLVAQCLFKEGYKPLVGIRTIFNTSIGYSV